MDRFQDKKTSDKVWAIFHAQILWHWRGNYGIFTILGNVATMNKNIGNFESVSHKNFTCEVPQMFRFPEILWTSEYLISKNDILKFIGWGIAYALSTWVWHCHLHSSPSATSHPLSSPDNSPPLPTPASLKSLLNQGLSLAEAKSSKEKCAKCSAAYVLTLSQ